MRKLSNREVKEIVHRHTDNDKVSSQTHFCLTLNPTHRLVRYLLAESLLWLPWKKKSEEPELWIWNPGVSWSSREIMLLKACPTGWQSSTDSTLRSQPKSKWWLRILAHSLERDPNFQKLQSHFLQCWLHNFNAWVFFSLAHINLETLENKTGFTKNVIDQANSFLADFMVLAKKKRQAKLNSIMDYTS